MFKTDDAPIIPLLPYFIGHEGNAINIGRPLHNVDLIMKLANRIASDLQNASSIPEQNTLSRFIIMEYLIRIMNVEELDEVADKLYVPLQSSKNMQSTSADIRLATW
jgi:hypothetical protein